MIRVGRIRWTAAERAELWRRWREGQSLSEIGRALERRPALVFNTVRRCGGFSPVSRQRSPRHLRMSEREEISRGLSAGWSIRRIAQQLGRAPSTVSREITRHGGVLRYRAEAADVQAWEQGRRPKRCKLADYPRLRCAVARQLRQDWSPEQICGWLQRAYPADPSMRVSAETIYRSLFIQARGVLKQELVAHLRSRRKFRHSRHATRVGQPRGQIVDAVSIRERPAEVADRAVPGHWEGDLLSGGGNTHVATLVERQSRFLLLVKLRGKDSATVVAALSRHVRKLPAELRRSLTWDRGGEMAAHKDFTIATDVQVYFCDPHSPWQRGSNENTNGLLRQYLPKGSDLSQLSQQQLNAIALRLNQRPRKTLAFQCPADKLRELLQ
jgi:IS30 family transposase